jgi:hypothetical protein
VPRNRRRSLGRFWAYAYLMVPAQPRNRLGAIQTILDDESTSGEGAWTGRLILERRMTHILLVGESPEPDPKINLRLETELRRLKVEFFRTSSIPVAACETGESEADDLEREPAGDSARIHLQSEVRPLPPC